MNKAAPALALILALLAATPIAAQVVQTPTEALAQDAATWALAAGLPADEALRHLEAQRDGDAAAASLTAEFADRLVGIAAEHRPAYRWVVLLTGDAPVPDRVVVAGGQAVPVTFRTGAAATRERLLVALAGAQAALRAALPHPPGMGIDPRTGTLVVLAQPSDLAAEPPEQMAARLSAIAGVTVTVRSLTGEARDLSGAVEGGGRLVGVNPADGRRYACTTGFTVTDGVRDGVVTAAHCPDTVSYAEPGVPAVALDFVGQWGWGFQDVQVHAAATPLAPLFLADTAKTVRRPVTAARTRIATRAGDVVCHRGERTGYSCAEVELTDFAPAGDLCGGACLPTWVAVAGPTCRGGDSGGPVFLGTVAIGIVKGGSYRGDGSCAFYYYMSTDYLPTGWQLLLAPDPR